MSSEDIIDPEEARNLLLSARDAIDADSDATEADRQPVELDQTRVGRLSRMDALQGQAMAAATERRRLAGKHRIDAALERLDAGEYGYCVACGEPISPARLRADPAVATCIDCAAG